MLAADKQALASVLKQSSLKIREKELDYFTGNFGAIAINLPSLQVLHFKV